MEPNYTPSVPSTVPTTPQGSRSHSPSRPVHGPTLHPNDIYIQSLPYDSQTTSEHQDNLHVPDGLHPYGISIYSASRSSLGSRISMSSAALNSVSRASGLSRSSNVHQPPIPRSRSRSRHGAFGVSPKVSSTNVAIPSGNIAVPVANHPGMSFKDRVMFPITPAWIERYDRDIKIPDVPSSFIVPPMTKIFEHGPAPPGWTPMTHPEGAPYFYHEEKRILTEANLYQQEALQDVNDFIDKFDDTLRVKDFVLGPREELVLEPMLNTAKTAIVCGYYIVDHENRCLFWLEDFNMSYLLREVNGAISPAHIKFELEAQYWSHWEYFPGIHPIPVSIVKDVKAMLLHAAVDAQTSGVSTAPFPLDELCRMLTFVKDLEPSDADPKGHTACVVGRVMGYFAHSRFLHFHGQHGARLSRDQSIYGHTTGHRSFLINTLSPLLFYAPDLHLVALEELYVDKLVHLSCWRRLMETLHDEWNDFILYNTIILAANVSFLAIPSVSGNNNGPPPPTRSVAQNASYLSVITSTGSIILALLLIRQNRSKTRETPEQAARYLHAKTHPIFGLEVLAVMYSLPYALLMWGMASFLVAFLSSCIAGTNIITRCIMSLVAFFICGLIAWSIWTGWRGGRCTQLFYLTRQRWRMLLQRFMNADGTSSGNDEKSEDEKSEKDGQSEKDERSDKDEKFQNTNARERTWSWSIFVRRPSVDSTAKDVAGIV